MNLPAGEPELSERLAELHGLVQIREAAESTKVYLVGGAVRDLLLGKGRADVDVVVEGDVEQLASRLGGAAVHHQRFSTATVETESLTVDLAAARSETYSKAGALPVIEPADLAVDLGRRDFTVNAMAIPLQGKTHLIDNAGGQADLEAQLIRVLHSGSFIDDPTRALRAARYAARLGFELESETEQLVRRTELESVSGERIEAELMKLCAEPRAAVGLGLLSEWGLIELRPDALQRVQAVAELLRDPHWLRVAEPALAVHAAALGHPPGAAGRLRDLLESASALGSAAPSLPSEAVAAAEGRPGVELVLARTMGAEWLDDYVTKWRDVALEITGADLRDAGVPEGPALGRGLAAALQQKLDGEIAGRDSELAAALAAAQGT